MGTRTLRPLSWRSFAAITGSAATSTTSRRVHAANVVDQRTHEPYSLSQPDDDRGISHGGRINGAAQIDTYVSKDLSAGRR
jgi:hypothetical protein